MITDILKDPLHATTTRFRYNLNPKPKSNPIPTTTPTSTPTQLRPQPQSQPQPNPDHNHIPNLNPNPSPTTTQPQPNPTLTTTTTNHNPTPTTTPIPAPAPTQLRTEPQTQLNFDHTDNLILIPTYLNTSPTPTQLRPHPQPQPTPATTTIPTPTKLRPQRQPLPNPWQQAYFEEVHILIPKSWSDSDDYEPSTWENNDDSDVTVDERAEGKAVGDAPVTSRNTPCGDLGNFILLTPQYLLNDTLAQEYGPREKVFLHEWSHLRYGVFDEYGEGTNFYTDSTGEIAGIRCPASLQGDMLDTLTKTRYCKSVGGLPDSNCIFKPDTSRLPADSASLMFDTKSKQVNQWCDNDRTRPETLHNHEAPNAQNKLCEGKSVWEVLRKHPDFQSEKSNMAEVPAPRFTLVKERVRRTVLVLDVSGSMTTNNRADKLRGAATIYIQTFTKSEEKMGIVQFDSKAKILANLTEINNTTRELLRQSLPVKTSRGTGIGDGLLKALQVLQQPEEEKDNKMKGGVIILLSDGEENFEPFIRDVLPKVKESDVRVHIIAITNAADENMENVARETGGQSFFYADNNKPNILTAIFQRIAAIGYNDVEENNVLLSDTGTNGQLQSHFTVDSTSNQNVTVIVQSDGADRLDNVTVKVVSPSGRLFTSSQTQNGSDAKLMFVYLGRTSQAGEYEVNVTSSATKKQDMSATVISKVAQGEKAPIIVKARWRHQFVPNNTMPQMLYVSVSKGYAPMLNVVVKASVTSSNAANSTLPLQVLLDNGAGCDVRKNDGIYSVCFTNFNARGCYNVMVTVHANKGTVISNGMIGIGVPLSAKRQQQSRNLTSAEPFQRVTTGGSFLLQDFQESVGDVFPPSRISDLEVSAVSPTSVQLEWTAPGGDLDQGTAAGYVLKVTTEFEVLYNNYTQVANVSDQYKLSGSLTSPQSSGSRESIIVHFNEGTTTYYFAVQAYDNSSNISPLSNIVSTTTPTPKKTPTSFNPDLAITLPIIGLVVVIVCVLLCLYYKRKKGERTKAN